jgi:hypothetical protein
MTTAPTDHSDLFYIRWIDMCDRLHIDPFDLARVSYSESGCRAAAHNPNGHASGLIQFMPDTLLGLGWTKGHEAFRQLDAAEQVPWVERYMRGHASWCTSDALCYVAVFLPALGAKAQKDGPEFVLCGARGPLAWAYGANKVLDKDGNGNITVSDLGRQLEAQCKGTRWDAIMWRMRQAMGLQPPTLAEPPDTLPEIPVVNTDIPPALDTYDAEPVVHVEEVAGDYLSPDEPDDAA